MRLRLVLVVGVFALLCLPSPSTGAEGLTPSRSEVVTAICAACDRYQVDCTLPLAVARRESGFGANVVSQTDHAADGRSLSIGSFQWHEWGLGRYGEYYQRYGLGWRYDLYMDVDMGVRLTTSHLRGGPSFLSHWWTPVGLNTTNLPVCSSVSERTPADEPVQVSMDR